MPWSLTRFDPKNLELQGRYFAAVGKALAIANNFEHKALHVLGVLLVGDAAEDGVETPDLGEYYREAFDERLFRAIQQIANNDRIAADHIETLHEGRRSRNFLAHEGPGVFNAADVTKDHIYQRVIILEPHVRSIARADNIVSAWDYEIQEGHPAPQIFMKMYEARVVEWTFEDLLSEARKYVRAHE